MSLALQKQAHKKQKEIQPNIGKRRPKASESIFYK
jgi:hypothetical protein